MDEPFSSLDFRTARYLRLELKRIQSQLNTTMLFVPEDSGTPFYRVAIDPGDVYISPYPPPGPRVNRFQGRIKNIQYAGGMARVEVRVTDQRLHARMSTDQARALHLRPGDTIYGILKLRALHGC